MEQSELTLDFSAFLSLLNEKHVDYLLIGGFAVIAHGYVRATRDLDAWVAIDHKTGKYFLAAHYSAGDVTVNRIVNG